MYHCTLSSFLSLSRGKKEKKKGKRGEARVSRADITNNTKYVISSEMEMEHVRKHERIVTLGSRCGVAPGTPIPGPFGFSKFRKPFSRWRRSTINPLSSIFGQVFRERVAKGRGREVGPDSGGFIVNAPTARRIFSPDIIYNAPVSLGEFGELHRLGISGVA